MAKTMGKQEQNWISLYNDMIEYSAVIKDHPAKTIILRKLADVSWGASQFTPDFIEKFPDRFETLAKHYDEGVAEELKQMAVGAAYSGVDKKSLSETLLNYAVNAQTKDRSYSMVLLKRALEFNGGVLTETALKHIAFIDENMSWQALTDMNMTWRDRPDSAYENLKEDYIDTPEKKIQVGNAIVDYALEQIDAEAPRQVGGAKRLFSKRILRGMAFGTSDNKATAYDALQRITDTHATAEHELNEQFEFLDAIQPVIGKRVILNSLEYKVMRLSDLAESSDSLKEHVDARKSAAATALYIAAHDPTYLKRNKSYFAEALNNPIPGAEDAPNPDFHLWSRMMYPHDATFYNDGWFKNFHDRSDSMFRNASYAFAEAVKLKPNGLNAVQYAEDAITSHPTAKHKSAMLGFLTEKVEIGGEQGHAALGKINNLVKERILDAEKAKKIKALYPKNASSVADKERELINTLYAKHGINT